LASAIVNSCDELVVVSGPWVLEHSRPALL
jgi:hypothetical protein